MSEDLLKRYLLDGILPNKTISNNNELSNLKEEIINDRNVPIAKLLKLKQSSKISSTKIITIAELLELINKNLDINSKNLNKYLISAQNSLSNQDFQEFIENVSDFKKKMKVKRDSIILSIINVIEILIKQAVRNYNGSKKLTK